jgi:hypothetical protein
MARASLLLLCFVLLSFAAGWLTVPAARTELRSWYGKLAAAAIIVPLGILVGHYVTFWILQHLRQFTGLLLIGAIIAFAPPLINYLFTGTAPTTRAVFVSSTISGIIASAGTSLAEQWAKTLTARSAPEASRS